MKVINLLKRYGRVWWGKGESPVVAMHFAFVPKAFDRWRDPFSSMEGPSEEWVVFDTTEMELDDAILLLESGEQGKSGTYLPLMPRIFRVSCDEAALSTVHFERVDCESPDSPYLSFITIKAVLPRDTRTRYVQERCEKKMQEKR